MTTQQSELFGNIDETEPAMTVKGILITELSDKVIPGVAACACKAVHLVVFRSGVRANPVANGAISLFGACGHPCS